MSRLLVVGYTLPALIPEGNKNVPRAFNLRTAQLVEALLQDGHEIIVCSRLHKGEVVPQDVYPYRDGELHCFTGGYSTDEWYKSVDGLIKRYSPQGVVATSLVGALIAVHAGRRLPLWVDIYGDPITDLQMILNARGHNRGLRANLWLESIALRGGDIFSVCSNPQKFALIGKLSSARRIEYRTLEHDFVHTIPPAYTISGRTGSKPVAEFPRFPSSGAFNILWYGGYNGWADTETLFSSLEYAMDRNNRIHFTSIGEGIGNPRLFQDFSGWVRNSRHSHRYHIHGWQPIEKLRGFVAASHLGISVLKNIYETQLGAPTRVVEMIALGLPCLSVGCELSAWLADSNACLTAEIGDAVRIGTQILQVAEDQTLWESLSRRGLEVTATSLSAGMTARALRTWAAQPHRAPDRGINWRSYWEDNLLSVFQQFSWYSMRRYY